MNNEDDKDKNSGIKAGRFISDELLEDDLELGGDIEELPI